MADPLPTPVELLAATAALLDDDNVPRRSLRIARQLVLAAAAQVERSSERADSHRARLRSLDARDDEELCLAIERGSHDDRLAELISALRADLAEYSDPAEP